jgi:hypothetical protein
VPTLILQGNEDLRTPPEWSAAVAARIPGAKRLVVPGVGHSTISDPRSCSAVAIVRFVRGVRLPSCKRVQTGVPAVAAAPQDFDSLPGYRSLPRKVGRTVRAIAATIDDLRLVLSPAMLASSGGGLRGGRWEISGPRLLLHRYEAVRGVRVTGGGQNSLRLTVSGSEAAAGTVTLRSRGRLTGRLGGRRISVRLATPTAAAAARTAANVRIP